MSLQAELVLDSKNALGEGPWWNEAERQLYWVDIERCRIHWYNPATGESDFLQLDQKIGAAVQTASEGQLLCALQHGIYFLDLKTGQTTPIFDPEADVPGNRFNDGKCDPAGRFWAGTMSMTGEKNKGALYCLDPVTGCRKVLDGVTISNGLAWSPDHRTLYYIDTPTREIAAFPYDPETGALGERRVAVRFGDEPGSPDGMTIDSEGMLWVAVWGGSRVDCWNPATGKRLETIAVPATNVTSCAFGGDGLDELYITTASVGLDPQAQAEEPLAGGLFRASTGTRGFPAFRYGAAAR